MPFELLEPTPAQLATVTNRTEKHGDDDVPAVSLGLRFTAVNTMLKLLHPGLLDQLYCAPERPADGEQLQLEGTEATSLPLLRSGVIERLELKAELIGWRCCIEFGIDDSTTIDLAGCKVDKFRVVPFEGGSIELSLRIGTRDIDEIKAGRLAMLNGHEINVQLIAPEKPAATIDGTVDAFEKDLLSNRGPDEGQDATDAFVAAHAGG